LCVLVAAVAGLVAPAADVPLLVFMAVSVVVAGPPAAPLPGAASVGGTAHASAAA
jgi:hypothetical protein